jgi:hypothetical protein
MFSRAILLTIVWSCPAMTSAFADAITNWIEKDLDVILLAGPEVFSTRRR